MQNDANHVHDLESEELAPGRSLLYGQYTIQRHLIDGGFGTTYLAKDSLDRSVVVKECFPASVCRRVNGEVRPRKACHQDQYQKIIRSFLREALRLAKFEHPNIVKVHQVFQENNTAYIVMDYVDGMDLLSMLDIDPARLTDERVADLLRETLNALDYVHEMGMLHRDISPDNLLLDSNDKLTLIDFGAAREDDSIQTRARSSVMSVKDGYSPHEFYYTDGVHLPASDMYSVGATFYHLITGFAPPDCQKRVAALSSDNPDPYRPLTRDTWAFDESFLRSIDKALSIPQKDRFHSAREWLDYLDNRLGETAEEPTVVGERVEEPVVEFELEPSLVAKISSLVEDTNSKLDPVDPTKPKAEEPPEAAEDDDQEHLLVDMFGCPIDDVEAWLKEQDKQSRRKEGQRNKNQAPLDQTQDKTRGKSGFGLARVFSKFSRIRGRSEAVAQQ